MIVRMAKVEIIGPKEQVMAVLEELRGQGIFQPDPELMRTSGGKEEFGAHSLVLGEDEVRERQQFEQLREKIQALLAALPDLPAGETRLHSLPVMDVVAELVERHLDEARNLQERLAESRGEEAELARDLAFWETLAPMLAELPDDADLEIFGLAIHDTKHLDLVRRLLQEQLDGQCEVSVATTADGTLVGLAATSRHMAERLKEIMARERIPELPLPEELSEMSVPERIRALRRQWAESRYSLERNQQKLADLARRWRAVYRQALDWLEERLAIYRATMTAYQTRQCFVIEGWMAAGQVTALRTRLGEGFAGQVVLETLDILEEDLERVPVRLHNSGYFAPFEIFSGLLPLPKYTSYDPTPFIGLFFPVLFGMMLGDVGYGLVLLGLVLLLDKSCRRRPLVNKLGKILGVAALYTLAFGFLFGEMFGDFGSQQLGLAPLWVNREHAILPMILFAVSVGAAHILFGLGLGIWTNLHRRRVREALLKLLTVVLVLLGILVLIAWTTPVLEVGKRPLLAVIAVLLTLLVVCGGLQAPLELLKTFGNIISYVRIMAIGLCSVLLAVVANRLAGATGSLLAGLLLVAVLHAFNLLLGLFAPTVHALRLHYVEFFSKFLDLGGRRFEPLKRNHVG